VISLVRVELVNKSINDASKGLDVSHLANRGNLFFATHVINERVTHVLAHCKSEGIDSVVITLLLVLEHPRLKEWLPPDIRVIDEEYTTTRDCSGCGVSQVRDFKNKSHFRGKRDTLLRHECQHFVVVHDSVTRLNPLRVNITIKNDPLVELRKLVGTIILVHISHNDREHTVLPLLGLRVHATEKFIRGNGLGVDNVVNSLLTTSVESLGSHLPYGSLTTTWVTDNEARVTHFKNFSVVDTLHDEEIFSLETSFLGVLLNISLEDDISLGVSLNTWEEIVNETEENATIIDNNLGPVEITKSSHENLVFNDIGFSSLQFTSLSEH